MDERQIEIVQSTFAEVAPQADATAKAFYAKLFSIAPEVRPLFKGNMEEQGRKLMGTLSVVVTSLKDLDGIIPVAQNLAVKHVDYGVTSAHYEKVGAALLSVLSEGFADKWTPEIEDAWTTAYSTLSGVMIAAAEDAGGKKHD